MNGSTKPEPGDRPADGEEVLARLDRFRKGDTKNAPGERLILRAKVWEGRPFFDLRLAYRTATGGYAFTPVGTSIRRHEAPELIAALWKSLDAEGRERVKKYLARGVANDTISPAGKGGSDGSA